MLASKASFISLKLFYNPNLTIFEMIDKKGNKNTVHLLDSKPQGLEQSEDITLHGKMDGEVFTATDMQMKCPSKYNENKHDIQEIAQNYQGDDFLQGFSLPL